ncbi:MAG: signal peptidase I [Planctomycetaceae bacterium]
MALKTRPTDVHVHPLGNGRETVESIVVAFTLALLFRAFEAEAFIIPTGSMAPTLMGRHKDLACESCGRPFTVGASSEEDEQSQSFREELTTRRAESKRLAIEASDESLTVAEREWAERKFARLSGPGGEIAQLRDRLERKLVTAARCPNCGYVTDLVGDGDDRSTEYPSFSGDRIIVSKVAYDFGHPRRWDVVVFKYPEDAKINYIKRLVGLPGETIRIDNGDLWVSREGEGEQIARKPPNKLVAMLQLVHDSAYESEVLRAADWPTCWSDWSAPNQTGARWTSTDGGRSFDVDALEGRAHLRYRHLVPNVEQWIGIEAGKSMASAVFPTPIDDFQSYNAVPTRPHRVTDLAIETDVSLDGGAGSLAFDLVADTAVYRCRINLATGEARLEIPGGDASSSDGGGPKAMTTVRGTGSLRILFANVDREITLHVDGRPVSFDVATTYVRRENEPIDLVPVEPGDHTPSDLCPAGIEVATARLRIDRLRILRDIYYVDAPEMGMRSSGAVSLSKNGYPLSEGQFLMLGDNSSASKDSRLWSEGHAVDRELVIGKALFVFWPHAVPSTWGVTVPVGRSQLRLPSWPNFARMRVVR